MTDSDTGIVLHHLSASGSVAQASLPAEFAEGRASIDPTFAVDPDGTVWALGRSHIAEIAPGANSAKLIPIGQLPDNAVAEGFRPPDIRGAHPPIALADDGAGHIAFAMSATSIVRIFSPASNAFSDLQLPPGTSALALRYFQNGHLAIGLGNYNNGDTTHVVIASSDGSLSDPISVGNATLLNPYSDTAILVGATTPTILNSDGSTSAISMPAGLQPDPTLGGVQLGQNGELVVPTQYGITFLTNTSDAVAKTTYTYPTRDCGAPSLPGSQGPSGSSGPTVTTNSASTVPAKQTIPTICPVVPVRIQVGSDAAVWILNGLQTSQTTRLTVADIATY